MIDRFSRQYAFLSNYYECSVVYDGFCYASSEAAFQAQKTLDPEQRKAFTLLAASEAKRKGKKLNLRPDWEGIKYDIMYEVCKAKFTQHPDLAQKLLDTGNEMLVEGNNWGDKIWGQVKGEGKNLLGQILMRIRDELRNCAEQSG